MGGWNALPEEKVEAGTLATFQRNLGGYKKGEEERDTDRIRAEVFFFWEHHDWQGLVGPKGLFLCCNCVCSKSTNDIRV